MDPEDPDPGGSIHLTLFYGLWPRFTAEEEDRPMAAESVAGQAE
jgi:hypothetical protein